MSEREAIYTLRLLMQSRVKWEAANPGERQSCFYVERGTHPIRCGLHTCPHFIEKTAYRFTVEPGLTGTPGHSPFRLYGPQPVVLPLKMGELRDAFPVHLGADRLF